VSSLSNPPNPRKPCTFPDLFLPSPVQPCIIDELHLYKRCLGVLARRVLRYELQGVHGHWTPRYSSDLPKKKNNWGTHWNRLVHYNALSYGIEIQTNIFEYLPM
jgi:hypothetical protein